jgi:hypothetical protein
MEITTRLAVGQLVSIAQQAAEAASQPGRSRRRTRVTLAQVDRGALHYSVLAPGQPAQNVTVRFAEDGDLMRIAVDGAREDAAGTFVAALSRQIQAADPGSQFSLSPAESAQPAQPAAPAGRPAAPSRPAWR